MSSQTRQALDSAMQLAVQRHQAGDMAAAEALYGKVLSVEPTHPGALHNLGLIRLSRGDTAGALLLLGTAVERSPAEPTFQFNLGLAHQSAGDAVHAAAAYRQAVALNPAYRKAWENLGVALQDMQQHEDAIAAYRRAIALDASSVLAHQNLGNALRALGRLDEAELEYREVLDHQPLQADAAEQLAATRLSRGDYSGWDGYEWRYWSPESLRAQAPWHVPLPKWDGGELTGQSLLLYGEQGVGDEIMFASCVPDVAARAAQVTLYCDPRLAPLFARSFEGVTVKGKPRGGLPLVLEPDERVTLRCSLASLPLHLRREAAQFPGRAWLRADAEATETWRARLAQLGGRICIGISWRGGATRARAARSIELERLAPWFDVPGIRIVNLQYGDHQEEIARFNATAKQPLLRFPQIDPLRDMDDFAALVSALDAVITIDNSTAHLAGALGVPTWLLLPFQADWRWQRDRDDTPWYHSVRLFWQRHPVSEAWTEVIARVGAALPEIAVRRTGDLPCGTPASAAPLQSASSGKADVLLVNDTSYWYHWGCSCTSLALHEELRAAGHSVDPVSISEINALSPLPQTAAQFEDDGLFQRFRGDNPGLISRLAEVDSVVINGEGSLHDMGQTARALLYLAWLSKTRLGKRTRIVNHSCYPDTGGASPAVEDLYRKVFAAMDFIAVRESHSQRLLERLGIRTTEAFDCLPLFVQRHPPRSRAGSERRVVLAGTVQQGPAMVELLSTLALAAHARGYRVEILVGANAYLAQDDVLLLPALHARLRGRYTLVAATSEADWLATIQGADLLISGRFHHSIAAACLGTPLLLAASNTSKNEGLLERLGLRPEQVWISPSDPARATAQLDAMLADPQRGRVSRDTLARLRELAKANLQGL